MYAFKELDNKTVEVVCQVCKKPKQIELGVVGLERLKNGDMLIQRAIPHVAPELREMLISGTCPDCFKAMFAAFEEDEDFEEDDVINEDGNPSQTANYPDEPF